MNLYLLCRDDRVYHDQSRAHVVAAPTEDRARRLCDESFQREGWDNPETSRCDLIGTGEGPVRIVLTDFLEP